MSDTPLTDEQVLAYLTEDGSELVHASTARELETELAVTKDRLASILWSGALDNYTGGDIQKWAAEYTAELAAMKARAEKAEAELAKRDSEYLRGTKMVVESASVWQTRAEKAEVECLGQALLLGISGSREAALLSEIEQLEIELARLYTDLERFTGHGLLDCHQICDQRDAAVAELAAEREKVRVLTNNLRDLITAVTYADPPKLFNGVLCHEARVPVEFVDSSRAALAATKDSSK